MADWSAIFLVLTTGATETNAALGYAVFSIAMVAMRLMGDRVVLALGSEMSARLAGHHRGIGRPDRGDRGDLPGRDLRLHADGRRLCRDHAACLQRAANDPQVPPGAAIASVSTLGYGGMLLGPPLIGFVAEETSLRTAFLILAVLALLMAVMARAVKPPAGRRRGRDHADDIAPAQAAVIACPSRRRAHRAASGDRRPPRRPCVA